MTMLVNDSLDRKENTDAVPYHQKLLESYKGDWSYADLEPDEQAIVEEARPFTLTCPERMISLIRAVRYIVNNTIAGDFVECGVWKGGSMMIVALVLKQMGVTDRKLYLYDTYEGMTPPSGADVTWFGGSAIPWYNDTYDEERKVSQWCNCTLQAVRENILKTAYPEENIVFVKGPVEQTLPGTTPERIALLRLDTDWYESTYHEMKTLFPLLTKRGILIIDDFGHWKGAKKAIEQYFDENKVDMFLNRVDYTCRLGQKM